MSARINWIVVGLVVFFIAFNFTVDRYWVAHARELAALASTDVFARMFQTYAQADHGYFDKVSELELGLETVNFTLTQALTIVLLIALLRRWAIRVPLQIAIGTYVAYSVLFDWWCAAIAGFPGMDEKTPWHFFVFISANLPWLAGHAYVAWDGVRTALRALDARPAPQRRPFRHSIPRLEEARNLRQKVRAVGLSPNYWYPVAQGKNIKRGRIVATRFQGEPIAIWRGADGGLHAVEDRCCHRGVPLSLGTVEGCSLVCAYHGWTYSEDGRLARIPHELFGRTMPRLRLKSYPLRERYGLVWIFPGDPALAEAAAMPEIPEIEGPRPWAWVPLEFTWNAHHSIIIDNLSDLTHGYLHRRYDPFVDPVLVRHELRGDAVYCTYRVTLLAKGFKRLLVDRSKPDMDLMELCLEYPYQRGNTGNRVKHWIFLQPIDDKTTKIFFMFYFNEVKLPLTPFHMPQPLLKWVVRLLTPLFIRPVVSQDGVACAWEQEAYDEHGGRPLVEMSPAVPLFQELTVRKWQEYLATCAAKPPRHGVSERSATV